MDLSGNKRSFIARRLKLRDLHTFLAVIEHGSMAKAAVQLGITQPAVSQIVADLEHIFGVKLFDRTPKGAVPTLYGQALANGGIAAFDELTQAVNHIEFLANPTVGEVCVGCPETVAAILPPIIAEISRTHPDIIVKISDVVAPTLDLPQLKDRKLDLVLARVSDARACMSADEQLDVEVLFNDEHCIAVHRESIWARKRKITLADLTTGAWVLPPRGSANRAAIQSAIKAQDLPPLRIIAETFSVQLRINFLTNYQAITILPRSMLDLCAESMFLKVLPIPLRTEPWPVVMATIKNRTLNPVAKLFMDITRSQLKRLEILEIEETAAQ
jgi:DNA-binding transcriptional LysR family regulator